jgi:hypothetical protein
MAGMRKKAGIVVVAAVLVAAGLSAVWADIATPRPQWTMVRMESETVSVALGEKRVSVEAVFNMYNEGKTGPVRMGYPLGLFETELHDFAVIIDDKAVENVRTEAGAPAADGPMGRARPGGQPGTDEAYRFEGPYKQWKVWDVAMESHAPKTIKVKYWVEPAQIKDADKGDLLFYAYTLRTGATWKGKINKAVINVTLQDVAPSRLVRVMPVGAITSKEGKALTWTMENFKPTDNIEIIFRPSEPVKTAALAPAR